MIYTRVLGGSARGTKLTHVIADHLGSTDVLLTSTWNGNAFASQTLERHSFDAWGERRDATTQISYRASDSDAFRTATNDYDRGYIGHEQLDDSGLIHMNGRIYDPELGRFLSPDPVVQIPEYSQNFNRYSYVLNNPLNATDPSGFSFISKLFHKVGSWIKENWRTIVVLVVAAILVFTPGGQALIGGLTSALAPGLTAASWTVGGITISGANIATAGAIGSITGGLNSALHGGDLGDVLRGAVVGGIQGGISGGVLHGMEGAAELSGSLWDKAAHIVGHGIVGGASNVAMGGKFQDGFLSASASAYAGWTFLKNTTISQTIGASGPGRTVVAGIVGGTASVLGGGKFSNGAYTAAFQHLLNHQVQKNSKIWYGIGRDQYLEMSENYDHIQKSYAKDSNISFNLSPTKADLIAALKKYDVVIYHTHGTEYGLEYATKTGGGSDPLTDRETLSFTKGDFVGVKARVFCVLSCYPDANMANITTIHKIDGAKFKIQPVYNYSDSTKTTTLTSKNIESGYVLVNEIRKGKR